MTVHRRNPLPTGPACGRLLIAETVARTTTSALRRTDAGRSVEQCVLWLGRILDDGSSLIVSSYRPVADNGPFHVRYPAAEVGVASRAARAHEISVIAQVHTHPGRDTRHSDGDDQLVLMPFAGMFSLVVADYGYGHLLPARGAGLHQFQDGRWTRVTDSDAMIILPGQLPSLAPTTADVTRAARR